MEIRAYNELYLNNAQIALATMTDYAVNAKYENIDVFFQKFIVSGIAAQFEIGNPAYISGLSGIDLYRAVTFDFYSALPVYQPFYCTKEYWTGWALAYYQWFSNKPFATILSIIPASEIVMWYPTMHESDITHFVEAMNGRFSMLPSKLKAVRTGRGLTQAQLSQFSGVSLRLIQQYEQKQQDILYAPFNVLSSLCNVLGCTPSDLIDPPPVLQPDFSSQLMQRLAEQNCRQFTWQVGSQPLWAAQNMANCYGYISQFPQTAVQQQGNQYQINKQQFYENWNDYWGKIAAECAKQQQQTQKMIQKFAKEALGEAIRQSGNKDLSTAYDLYSIINADNLTEAIVKTAQFLSGAYRMAPN